MAGSADGIYSGGNCFFSSHKSRQQIQSKISINTHRAKIGDFETPARFIQTKVVLADRAANSSRLWESGANKDHFVKPNVLKDRHIVNHNADTEILEMNGGKDVLEIIRSSCAKYLDR